MAYEIHSKLGFTTSILSIFLHILHIILPHMYVYIYADIYDLFNIYINICDVCKMYTLMCLSSAMHYKCVCYDDWFASDVPSFSPSSPLAFILLLY